MAIMAPWPPDDPQLPLPFDQRGCCWPWGPDGPWEKVQMRYAARAYREDGGAMHPNWIISQIGVLFIADELGLITHQNYWSLRTTSLLTSITIEGTPIDRPTQWQISATIGIGGIPITICNATGFIPEGGNTETFSLPITTIVGPAPRPDHIEIIPTRWWETSSYPYFP